LLTAPHEAGVRHEKDAFARFAPVLQRQLQEEAVGRAVNDLARVQEPSVWDEALAVKTGELLQRCSPFFCPRDLSCLFIAHHGPARYAASHDCTTTAPHVRRR
jgi:hypothetical protein